MKVASNLVEVITKILLLDIETSPNLAYVWGIWEQNISLSQMVTSSKTLCWAAKWLGEKTVMFDSIHQSTEKQMLRRIHKLLDEADVVVHYNGRKFDVPTLNKEFLLNGMAPPSPYKQVDMLTVSRGAFRFQSNKLDYVAQQLGLGQKTSHEGFQLWIKCMADEPAAWKRMKKYNMNDVVLLEKVYLTMLPWIKGHPNHGQHTEDVVCPKCGQADALHQRGSASNLQGTYKRYQCKCGGWARGAVTKHKTKGRLVAL
jgi:DNA polymerase elongation subunit (family B)